LSVSRWCSKLLQHFRLRWIGRTLVACECDDDDDDDDERM